MKNSTPATVEILDYNTHYRNNFKEVNTDWMNRAFGGNVENHLNSIEEKVSNNGGFILFAQQDEAIVGACAVVQETNKVYEIADLAVSPAHRGKGIGKQLLAQAVERVKTTNAREIALQTSSKMKVSLEMFKTFGFRETEAQVPNLGSSDVKMVLSLK